MIVTVLCLNRNNFISAWKNRQHSINLGNSRNSWIKGTSPLTSLKLASSFLLHHLHSHPYRSLHARRICTSFPCNLIGCSVVNGGSDDGQAKRYIYTIFKVQELERNKPLVMIHADNTIKFVIFYSTVKKRFRGQRV